MALSIGYSPSMRSLVSGAKQVHRIVVGGQLLLVGQGGEGQVGVIVLAAQGQPQQVVGKVGVFGKQGAVRVAAKDIKENLKLENLLIGGLPILRLYLGALTSSMGGLGW